MKAVSPSAGSFQREIRVAELESALETKKLEWQTLPGLVAKTANLHTKVNPL